MKRPIFDTVIKYSKEGGYPWHMPGHKRLPGTPKPNRISGMPEQNRYGKNREDRVWQDIYAMDFTEIPGLDEYHSPEGIIKEAQLWAAEIYGAKNSYFLVNGSTVGILAAMSAVCLRGGSVLIGRNCHRAVYHGVEMLDLKPYYVYPEWLEAWDMYGGVSAEEIERSLETNPDIRAVILTSPTYEGVLSDIAGISEVVHAHDAVLIVDEAHGAHLPFLSRCDEEYWHESACNCGADVVIQSLHKTLPAMTQTAILHRVSERVDEDRLFHYISMYQSTSPSYVFMASMDYAVHFMAAEKDALLKYSRRLKKVRERIGNLSHIRLFSGKALDTTCAKGYDNAKLVLSAKHVGMSGMELADQLAVSGQIVEMAGCSYVICMTSVMDSEEAFDRLAQVLEELDIRISEELADNIIRDFALSDMVKVIPEQGMHIADAFAAGREWRPLTECEGSLSGEYVYAYPPGSPILVPGERISKDILLMIDFYVQAGLNMKGIRDNQLCVVKNTL